MIPDFSVDISYLIWLWRYELMFACSVIFAFVVAICWIVRRQARPSIWLHDDGASEAELPSRTRIVSAAHCRTPSARMVSALPVPLPRTGDPNRQSDRIRSG